MKLQINAVQKAINSFKLENIIDQVVYELYGLSEEEIEIVDENV